MRDKPIKRRRRVPKKTASFSSLSAENLTHFYHPTKSDQHEKREAEKPPKVRQKTKLETFNPQFFKTLPFVGVNHN